MRQLPFVIDIFIHYRGSNESFQPQVTLRGLLVRVEAVCASGRGEFRGARSHSCSGAEGVGIAHTVDIEWLEL